MRYNPHMTFPADIPLGVKMLAAFPETARGHRVARLAARLFFLLLMLSAWLPASAAGIGTATLVSGEVDLLRDGGVYSLAAGVDVFEGDIVKTTDEAHAQLEMADGSILAVGPASEVYLADYLLEDDQSVSKAAVNLLRGFLRFVTAKLRKNAHYEFNTHTVTLGIRGTEGVIEADSDSTSLQLEEGEVDVHELDDDGAPGEALRVHQGQFIQRARAQRTRMLDAAPAEFTSRLAPSLRGRPGRRLGQLARRGVNPQRLRNLDADDLRQLYKSNKRVRKNLEKRFRQRMQDPEFRERLKEKRREKREAVKERRHSPTADDQAIRAKKAAAEKRVRERRQIRQEQKRRVEQQRRRRKSTD